MHACAVRDVPQLDDLYELLNNHYVEDSDAKFRFDYSRDFLKWSVDPPSRGI